MLSSNGSEDNENENVAKNVNKTEARPGHGENNTYFYFQNTEEDAAKLIPSKARCEINDKRKSMKEVKNKN